MAKSAAGKVAPGRGRSLPMRFVGCRFEKYRALKLGVAPELHPQLVHLLRDVRFHVAITAGALIRIARKIRVLRGECSQKCADQIYVAVRQMELRIVFVEEQRVTRLAVRGETDPLIEPAAGLRFVAVIAAELLPVHRRNVVPEMPLVIEAQDIGIARLVADQLKLRMRVDKGRKYRGVTALRPRHLEND